MIKIFTFILPFLIINSGQSPVFQQLVNQFESGLILQAEMEHLFRDGFTGEESFHKGRLIIGVEKYLVEVDEQLIYVDGKISRVYNSRENKVILSNYYPEDDDFAPSRFFSKPPDSYTVSESKFEDGSTRVTLTSADPFEIFQEVSITLNSNGMPLEIQAKDQTENIFTTFFSNSRFIRQQENTFRFSYPESAEIIDLRE